MTKRISFVLAVLLLTGVMQAKAQETWYLGIDGAVVNTGFASDDTTAADNTKPGVRIYYGKKINDKLAFELGYLTALSSTLNKKYKNGGTLEYVSRADAFDFSLLFAPLSQLSGLKLKVGLALMGMHTDRKEDDPRWDSVTHSEAISYKMGFIGGISYEQSISNAVSIVAGYTRYQNLPSDDTNTWHALDHSNNVVSLGVHFKF
jgi:opacity protein-like surface antigen